MFGAANIYGSKNMIRFRMPENSIPKEAAYQIINDELMLDGNPRLNLASFVTTWMEPECDKLMMAAINKNYVDMDEYPVTTELQVSTPHQISSDPFCFTLYILSLYWLLCHYPPLAPNARSPILYSLRPIFIVYFVFTYYLKKII